MVSRLRHMMAMSSDGDERICVTLHIECLYDNSHILLNITCLAENLVFNHMLWVLNNPLFS